MFTDSRGAGKEWPGFDALTRLIWEQIPGSRVAWCAGQTAAPGRPRRPHGRFLNLTGCPFDEMIALCRQPSVFIGNDSGPMHLSAAVGQQGAGDFRPHLAAALRAVADRLAAHPGRSRLPAACSRI